ncbi:MAG: hypothetical protein A2W85_13345 [Bacteroidetes bacterium GWF2_41_31]|nr:MAG: hypothetical protein A2W85_13345 [Bacteroidetes bacterium GWF2_41_31]
MKNDKIKNSHKSRHMRHIYILIIIVCFHINNLYGQQDITWIDIYGGTGWDGSSEVQQTIDDGYIFIGWTHSNDINVSGNNGERDVWVVKLTSQREIEWQKCIGGSDWEHGSKIFYLNDTSYMVLATTKSNDGDVTGNHGDYDGWLIKLDLDGNILWQSCYGGEQSEYFQDICQTNDGGYLVVGSSRSNYINGTATGNNGSSDSWIMKLDSLGSIEWYKVYGGYHEDVMNNVMEANDGGYLVAGTTYSNDGDVTGFKGGTDCWILKLDATGNIEWNKCFGGSDNDYSSDIIRKGNDGYIVAAYTGSEDGDITNNNGGYDLWVFEIDNLGNIEWQKCYGGSLTDQPVKIRLTIDGNLIITGNTWSNDGDVSGLHGQVDIWILKIDSQHDIMWQKCIGGWGDDRSSDVLETEENIYTIIGITNSYEGDIPFNYGDKDICLFEIFDNCSTSYDTIYPVVCDSYISPSGKKFLDSGIFYDTLNNMLGCDSIIMINLAVNKSSDNWRQLGQDIYGDQENSKIGFALDMSSDGNIMAYRSMFELQQLHDSSYVQAMERVNGNWVQMGQKIFTDQTDNNFGCSISLSADGNIVAISAIYHYTVGTFTGRVYVFEYINGVWVQMGQILDGEASYEFFGNSVSLSSVGNILAVGAAGNDGGGIGSGCVKVYEFLNGSWDQLGQDIIGEAPGDGSGSSVSISGDGLRVAIGAVQNDGNGPRSGHARIYEFVSGTWVQIGQDLDGEYAGENFGISVDLSSDGNEVAVGGYLNRENGSGSGHVRVFEYANNAWMQIGQDIDGEGIQDWSGTDVRLSSDGKIVAVDSYNNDENGTNSGQVRVFENINNDWVQLGRSILGDAEGDLCGYSIGLSAEGNILAVSAPHNDGNGDQSGQIRVFQSNIMKIDTTICDSFLSPSGLHIWDSTGAYFDTIATVAGCDSVIRYNLIVNYTSYSYDTLIACDSLVWINGITYYESIDSATCVLPNSTGCDSIIELNLTLQHPPTAFAGEDVQICEGDSILLSGDAGNYSSIYWTTSGDGSFDDPGILTPTYYPGTNDFNAGTVDLVLIAYANLPCIGEQVDTLELFFNYYPEQPQIPAGPIAIDLDATQTSEYTITQATNSTSYEWFLEPYTAGIIEGADTIGTVYWNSGYAGLSAYVHVGAINECGEEFSDTLGISVSPVTIRDLSIKEPEINISPNPSDGRFNIAIKGTTDDVDLIVMNSVEQIILQKKLINTIDNFEITIDISNNPTGTYYLKFVINNRNIYRKVILF